MNNTRKHARPHACPHIRETIPSSALACGPTHSLSHPGTCELPHARTRTRTCARIRKRTPTRTSTHKYRRSSTHTDMRTLTRAYSLTHTHTHVRPAALPSRAHPCARTHTHPHMCARKYACPSSRPYLQAPTRTPTSERTCRRTHTHTHPRTRSFSHGHPYAFAHRTHARITSAHTYTNYIRTYAHTYTHAALNISTGPLALRTFQTAGPVRASTLYLSLALQDHQVKCQASRLKITVARSMTNFATFSCILFLKFRYVCIA